MHRVYSHIPFVLLVLLVAQALARIAGTYSVFCQTYDEPAKLARGCEWLLEGHYSYVDQPPLACLFFAVGPVLAGRTFSTSGDPIRDGNAVLYGSGNYWRALTLARLGNLPFFVAAMALVWVWSKEVAGAAASIIALLLFTSLPTVLAQSSIVSTDMATTATVGWVFYVCQRWLERPTAWNSVALGILGGLALLVKFSAVVFLPVGAASLAAVKCLCDNRLGAAMRVSVMRRVGFMLISVLTTFWIVWAGYLFSLGRVRDTSYIYAERAIDKTLARIGPWRQEARVLLDVPVPTPEFFQGLIMIIQKEHAGHANYFLGERRHGEGSWGYFPTMLIVKTPIPFLALAAIGSVWLFSKALSLRNWRLIVPAVLPVAMIVAVLPSDINIGVRHILPVYPFLAVLAAAGAVGLWRLSAGAKVAKLFAATLLVAHVGSGALAHPDYLAYFNCLAGPHPEEFAVDSDLDWGQDLHRLSVACKERDIRELYLAYFGTADITQHELPGVAMLRPHERARGWIAISLTTLKASEGYEWLEAYEPTTLVGRSIRLYHID